MRQDWATALDAYDDTVELDETRLPGGGVHRGRDGVTAFFTRWVGSWTEFEITPLELIDVGDDVVAVMDISGTGRASGVSVTMRAADVYTLSSGKVVRQVGYPDAAEALEAAGLRE